QNLRGEENYQPWLSYGRSKLCNLLFARHLAPQLTGEQQVNAVHPGVIPTKIIRELPGIVDYLYRFAGILLFKSIQEGAASQLWAVSHPDAKNLNGEYIADCNPAQSSALGQDRDLARRLWERSEEIAQELGFAPRV
ncbi:MAG: hypothetical protein MK135_05155, partial [Polyangiaceae bacterium]|nr:hypothetical protein [Polyangiaceae bacterium]